MDRALELAGIVRKHNNDRTRLIDILWAAQEREGFISHFDLQELGRLLGLSVPALREVMSFYHFFRDRPSGRHQIYLDSSIIAEMNGLAEIRDEFERQLGIKVGQTTSDGLFGLFETSCIGMSDQAPAALINLEPFTALNRQKVATIVNRLRAGAAIKAVAREIGLGDGANAGPSVESTVSNNLREKGSFILAPLTFGTALKNALAQSADKVIDVVTASGLRGRGGAGFPTGRKWAACKSYPAAKRYVVCNADEGEPGTFKDRLLLTEYPGLLIEGMAIAAYAIGAKEAVIYLRAEYKYLEAHLLREIGRARFPFELDIRVQLGAGAYVCGEESALLESMEGKRGEPRLRPPFPVESGYLDMPTVVNNVETYALVAQIFSQGGDAFRKFGTSKSPGVRLLSVSGDVDRPGIYEIPWGIKIGEVLKMVGARQARMIQVGGPSGIAIQASDVNREISYEDLPTGGSFMVFGERRDLFAVLENFMTFFVNESCGNCTPCRAGNVALRGLLRKFVSGQARQEDLNRIESWANIVKRGSRCGLGGSSPNVLTTTKAAFPELFRNAITPGASPLFFDFDDKAAVADYDRTVREMK